MISLGGSRGSHGDASRRSCFVQVFAFTAFFTRRSLAIPHPQWPPEVTVSGFRSPDSFNVRQSSFTNLQVPSCALACYINTLTTDGCASETDFACHCSSGDLLKKADTCVKRTCDANNAKKSQDKIERACRAANGGSGNGGTGNRNGDGAEATPSGSGTSTIPTPTSNAATSTSISRTVGPSGNLTSTPNTTNASSSSLTRPTSNPPSTNSPPDPTDQPFAPISPNRELSPGAKAGISVSVSLFATAILLTIFLYIRRLKKDLALAKAAAGIPESVWRASITTAAAPSRFGGQRRSWSGRGWSASRRRSSGGAESPISPLSPGGGMEEGINGLLKRKRGHVLSIVVEREDEDSNSSHQIVHEPVPGQKEGLVDPLELDGEYTGLIELPTSITPRTRSMERRRERSSSLSESSRPSTGGLEKIDERQGL